MADATPANTTTYATGGDRAPIVIVPMPREVVAGWLPEGVELMTPPILADDPTHLH